MQKAPDVSCALSASRRLASFETETPPSSGCGYAVTELFFSELIFIFFPIPPPRFPTQSVGRDAGRVCLRNFLPRSNSACRLGAATLQTPCSRYDKTNGPITYNVIPKGTPQPYIPSESFFFCDSIDRSTVGFGPRNSPPSLCHGAGVPAMRPITPSQTSLTRPPGLPLQLVRGPVDRPAAETTAGELRWRREPSERKKREVNSSEKPLRTTTGKLQVELKIMYTHTCVSCALQ